MAGSDAGARLQGPVSSRVEIIEELQRLKEHDIVRLIDALAVKKDENGEADVLQLSDLNQDEAMEFGAIVGALVGLGAAGEEGAEAGTTPAPRRSRTVTCSTRTRSGT